MHNTTTWNERLIVGKLTNWYQWYLSKDGVGHDALNPVLYITTMREKYVRMYEKFISQLLMYANELKSSFERLFANFSFTPMKLQEILKEVKKAIQISNPDYDVVIKRLHLYYDMKLVTFGINKE